MRKESKARTHNQECRDWMCDFMRTNPDMEERVGKAETRKPGSTTLHRESEKDRMDRMRRKLARRGPAAKADTPGTSEGATKLKYNPMLQPKESANERKDVEMKPNSEPASGSSENVGLKRKREDTEYMELDEVRLENDWIRRKDYAMDMSRRRRRT